MAVGDTNLTNLVLSGDLTVGDDVVITGDLTVTGATVIGTALAGADVNTAVSRQRAVIQIAGGSTIADGATYKQLFSVGRALTVNRILIAAAVKPAGGTNTVTIKKNVSGNTLLNAATFDPTTITANATIQALTLTSTAADLALDADDTVYIEWVAGTQTTDAQAAIIVIEYTVTDL